MVFVNPPVDDGGEYTILSEKMKWRTKW